MAKDNHITDEIRTSFNNLNEFVPITKRKIKEAHALGKQVALGGTNELSKKQRKSLAKVIDNLFECLMLDFEEIEYSAAKLTKEVLNG